MLSFLRAGDGGQSIPFGQGMGNKEACVTCLQAKGALRALGLISGLLVQPVAESKTLWAWAAASCLREWCPWGVGRYPSFLPSSFSSCAPRGSFVRADLGSGHCASALPADQAVNVPASLRRPRKAPELGSDPLPGAGAVFWCPTGSWDLWCLCCKYLSALMEQGKGWAEFLWFAVA